jgi:hypothetical protein
MPSETTTAEMVESRSSSPPDDLAFFSLSDNGVAEDSRVALEQLGLVRHEVASQPEDYEPWPLILM